MLAKAPLRTRGKGEKGGEEILKRPRQRRRSGKIEGCRAERDTLVGVG